MIITIAIFLLATAILLKFIQSIKIRKSLILLNFLSFLAVSSGFVPQMLAGSLSTHDGHTPKFEGKVTLILIGAGLDKDRDGKMTIPFYGYSRAVKTLTSFIECSAKKATCNVIVSGGKPVGSHVSEAAVYAEALKEMGIPASKILLEDRSRNTWENAKLSLSMVSHDVEKIFVITNELHEKRTSLYFRHFNKNINTLSSDSAPNNLNPMHWGTNWFLYDVCLHELTGLARYHIYQTLGLNKQAPDA